VRRGFVSRWYNRLTIEHVWALAVLAGIFIFLNLHPIRPHDFWWHMAVGREIVQTGQIPVVDTFSQTMHGQPYPSYSMFWLMEVFFYLVYSLGGPALVVFMHTVMVGSAYAILLYLCKQISTSWRLAAFTALFAAALGLNDWNVRPQAVTFVLGALCLLAMHNLRQGGRKTWLLVFPLGMVVWVNSHGTFFIGFVLIGMWLAEELWQGWKAGSGNRRRQGIGLPLLALLLAGLASLVNPRGLGIIAYLTGMLSSSPVQRLVPEWAAPTFDTLTGALFLVGLLLSALVLAVSPHRPTLHQLMTFLFFAALSLKTGRGIVWFGLVMAPVLTEHFRALAELVPRPVQQSEVSQAVSRRLNALFAGGILMMVLITLPWFKDALPLPELKRGLISAETPVEATRFLLENQLPGPVFHDMAYGSYLIWAGQPDYPVFVDPRIELYPFEHWMTYISINNAHREWERELSNFRVRTMMLNKIEQPEIIKAAQSSEYWQQAYSDLNTIIFLRNK
jgi:hypothetical protein